MKFRELIGGGYFCERREGIGFEKVEALMFEEPYFEFSFPMLEKLSSLCVFNEGICFSNIFEDFKEEFIEFLDFIS